MLKLDTWNPELKVVPVAGPPLTVSLTARKMACGDALCGSKAVLHPFWQKNVSLNLHGTTRAPGLQLLLAQERGPPPACPRFKVVPPIWHRVVGSGNAYIKT
eukprot:1136924-Pelagomonas_calceolata.AAC.1